MSAVATATQGEFSDLIAKVESSLNKAEQYGQMLIRPYEWQLRHLPSWAPSWVGGLLGGTFALSQQFASQLDSTVGLTRQLASEPGRPWNLVQTGAQWVSQVGSPTDGMISTMTPQRLGSCSWAGSAGPVFNATLPAQQNALGAFYGIADGINAALTEAAGVIEEFWSRVAKLAAKLATDLMYALLLGSMSRHRGSMSSIDDGWNPYGYGGWAIYRALMALEKYTSGLVTAVQAFWSGMDATTGRLRQLGGDHSAFHGGKWPSPTIPLNA